MISRANKRMYLTIEEKKRIAESATPFERSFNRTCPGVYADPNPCIGFNESNYRECKFNDSEIICEYSALYKELEDARKNRKYLTYNDKKKIAEYM